MSHPHSLHVSSIEGVGQNFLNDRFLLARSKTKKAVHEMTRLFEVGMNEEDARQVCLQYFKTLGVQKHWHRPSVRIGSGTVLNFNHPIQLADRFEANTLFYVDVGPVWTLDGIEYEADFGDTFVFQPDLNRIDVQNQYRLIESARNLFQLCQDLWQNGQVTGAELYLYLKKMAQSMSLQLADQVLGHRLSDFPHHRFSKSNLADATWKPADGLWVFEVHVIDAVNQSRGAFYEDLLLLK
jgi:hypothetical protein